MPQQSERAETEQQGSAVRDSHGWRQEGRDLLRAVAGGAIVGMPLLYTMEMWWHGMLLSEWHLLGLLVAVLGVNFLVSLVHGFRDRFSPLEALMEAVTAVGVAILFATGVLALIGELHPDASRHEMAGKILLEAAVVSIGVSFANAIVAGRSRTGEDEERTVAGAGGDAEMSPARRQLIADLKDASATLGGSLVFSMNIAPTEEVLQIAARLGPWQQLAMLASAGLLCYVILFASGFQGHEVHQESIFQSPVAETTMTCALSLGVAAVLIVLLGQRETMSHPQIATAAVITLGLPAIVGGAAGRLII